VWRYKLDRIFLASLRTQILDFSAWIRNEGEKRMQLGSHGAQEDFYHHLLKAKDPDTGEGLSKRELWSESLILILAG
jgi:cytochrome P450